ncbi:checkpoint suppressor 1 [Danio aesculapii]|uniref:checkpoint suppressor 1 n=1 Tax=Danio aesculapii TaxID=1142201 RepID=UPI0024BF74EA|nr:checkpoint suppressor 1 [Danio aesculapii]
MGPVVMPPGKKAEGPSSGSVARGLSPLYQDTDAADLSLALSASLSRAEDEELTSLSWLHESTDLLTSLGQSGLRSVSPVQDANGTHELSPSSSPEPSEPPFHLSTGPSRKPPYSFSCLIFMAIEDAPSKRLPVKDIYGWILEHFPYFASAPTGWKNSVRHNLSLNKCFKKVDKDRSQSIGKGSLWSIDPDYRHNLIQALKKTPYHPYSPRLPKPSTSPSASPQQYHSPPLWPGSPLYRKNGGVLLQVPQRVIQHSSRVAAQGLFPVIRPLPLSPTSKRTTAVRSALGDFLTRAKSSLHMDSSPPASDEHQEEQDHTYSSSQGDAVSSSSSSSSCSITQGSLTEVKQEQKDFPLDATSPRASQPPQLRRPLWTKGDTLPLKKRRAENILVKKEEEEEEEEDEEMKEAAGSLLHLAGVRTAVSKNALLRRVQKELKEELKEEASD